MSIIATLEPYLVPATIGGVGTMLWASFNGFTRGINTRLDKLESTVEGAIREVTQVVVRQQTDQSEISALRLRQHKLEADVVGIDSLQARCSKCPMT